MENMNGLYRVSVPSGCALLFVDFNSKVLIYYSPFQKKIDTVSTYISPYSACQLKNRRRGEYVKAKVGNRVHLFWNGLYKESILRRNLCFVVNERLCATRWFTLYVAFLPCLNCPHLPHVTIHLQPSVYWNWSLEPQCRSSIPTGANIETPSRTHSLSQQVPAPRPHPPLPQGLFNVEVNSHIPVGWVRSDLYNILDLCLCSSSCTCIANFAPRGRNDGKKWNVGNTEE